MTEKERERRRKKFEEDWKPAYDAWIKLYPFTTENLDGEIWKPIPNYEEFYHGSNWGRIKSFHKGKVKIIQRGKRYKDAGGKIRAAYKHGETQRILTDEQRAQILVRYNAGGISQSALAKEFGVSQSAIWKIVNGK